MKKYHFQFPIRLFLSYLANIRSNYCNPQIIYVVNSFFFSCCKPSTCISCHRVLVVLTRVLQIFFDLTFSSVLALLSLWGSVIRVIWLRRYFDPPKSQEHPKHFQKILRITSYLFFSNATGGKNGSESNWYVLLSDTFLCKWWSTTWNNANGQFS